MQINKRRKLHPLPKKSTFPDISTQYFIHNASKPGRSAEKPATIETAQKKAARLKSIEADRLKGTMTKNINCAGTVGGIGSYIIGRPGS